MSRWLSSVGAGRARVHGGSGGGDFAFFIVFFKTQQVCRCLAGYDLVDGICSRPCPLGYNRASGTNVACTDPLAGVIGRNTTTNNDCVCVACQPGFYGAACDQTLAPAARGQSGALYPCTGRGTPDDASGYCICQPGFIGVACELDTSNYDCGVGGQPYRDNTASGVDIVGSTLTAPTTVTVAVVPSKRGPFDPVRYLMAYPDVADYPLDAWVHWSLFGIGEAWRDVWLTSSVHGKFDPTAYATAYGVSVDAALWHYINVGASLGYDAFVL